MKYLSIIMLLSGSVFCRAQDTSSHAIACCTNSSCCGAFQTPIGMMTDHIHGKGQLMLSYVYMGMMARGSQIGSTRVDDNTVYKSYLMSPETMTMQMHMVMAMYGITERFTAMLMAGFSANEMGMNMNSVTMSMPGMTMTMGNMTMTSNSSGFTDTKLYGLYNFLNGGKHRLIGSLGVSIPTGTIMATGTTMLGDNQRLPYDMQIGTGSFCLMPDLTYGGASGKFAYGGDAGADLKLNYNSLGYKTGNVFHATAWASYQLLPFLSCSIRPEVINAGKIAGSDALMDIPVYQGEDPSTKTGNYGGTWVNVYAGVNVHLNRPALSKWDLKMEYGVPVYQNLNGTQPSLRRTILAGVQYTAF